MVRRERHPVMRYGFAVAAVGAALGLRLLLQPVLNQEAPLLPFVISVILASSFGGLGPGLLATLLSAALANYFFLLPLGEFGVPPLRGLVQLALFLGIGLTVTGRFPGGRVAGDVVFGQGGGPEAQREVPLPRGHAHAEIGGQG